MVYHTEHYYSNDCTICGEQGTIEHREIFWFDMSIAHGSIFRNTCMSCGHTRFFDRQLIQELVNQ